MESEKRDGWTKPEKDLMREIYEAVLARRAQRNTPLGALATRMS